MSIIINDNDGSKWFRMWTPPRKAKLKPEGPQRETLLAESSRRYRTNPEGAEVVSMLTGAITSGKFGQTSSCRIYVSGRPMGES